MAELGYICLSTPPGLLLTTIKVYHIANIFSMGFSFGCAFSPTAGALIGFRFLCRQIAPLLNVLLIYAF